MYRNKLNNMKALIHNGKLNGKHPFVYRITKNEFSQESLDTIKDGYCYVIELTIGEYNYIRSIPEDIEISYTIDNNGKNIFFY